MRARVRIVVVEDDVGQKKKKNSWEINVSAIIYHIGIGT